jgi:hypothetical protein
MAARLYGIPFQSVEEISFWSGCPIQTLIDYQTEEVSRKSHFDWLIPFMSDVITPLYVQTKGMRYTMGRLNRCVSQIVGTDILWKDYVQRFSMPNGQLKNFLVAVRTAVMARDESGSVSILNRGSKSESASGNWVHYLAVFLSSLGMRGKIDCYDVGEVPSISVVRNFTINHCSQFYVGDGHEYTVVIDDASLGNLPVGGVFKSKFFSLKGQGSPFLHGVEGRLFSHVLPSLEIQCGCRICQVAAVCTRTFAEWQLLKKMTLLFDGPACDLMDHVPDLHAKGSMFQQLCVNPIVDVQMPMDVRSVLSMKGEVDIRVVDNHTVQKAKIVHPVEYIHNKGFLTKVSLKKCDDLEGKNVHFCGVDPGELGGTVFGRRTDGEVHVFAYSMTALMATSIKAPAYVWIPLTDIRGYTMTGKRWNTFYQHERNRVGEGVTRDVRYFREMGLVVEGNPAWTADVPGEYQLNDAQAYALGVKPISYYQGYSPLLYEFRLVGGQTVGCDSRSKFMFDIHKENFEYDDALMEGEEYVWVNDFGIVTVRKKTKTEWTGRPPDLDYLLRHEGRQRLQESDRLVSVTVCEQFFLYTVRVKKGKDGQMALTDEEFSRRFFVRRGLDIVKKDFYWEVQNKEE